MRGVRFTKAEVEALREVDELLTSMPCDTPRGWAGVMRKVAAAEAPADADHDAPKALQDALSSAARGKVVPLEGGWAMAAGMAKNAKATVEQATLIGEWMARQGWLTQPQTLLDVLRKWHQWLPKARSTQPPPSLQAGLGANGTGQGTAPAGKTAPARRPAQGFR